MGGPIHGYGVSLRKMTKKRPPGRIRIWGLGLNSLHGCCQRGLPCRSSGGWFSHSAARGSLLEGKLGQNTQQGSLQLLFQSIKATVHMLLQSPLHLLQTTIHRGVQFTADIGNNVATLCFRKLEFFRLKPYWRCLFSWWFLCCWITKTSAWSTNMEYKQQLVFQILQLCLY